MAGLGTKSTERRYTLLVHLVGETEEQRAEVRKVLEVVSDPPLEITEYGAQAQVEGPGDPDIAMVIFDGNEAVPLGYLQAHAERAPRPMIFALLRDQSPMLMRRVLHAGADEMLFLPLDIGAVTRALLKLSEKRRRSERIEGGVIYSVTGLSGGVGLTTLSANLALALCHTFDQRAALVDLDLQKGGQGVFLHVEPEQSIASLIDFIRKLDSIRLESALTKHPSGIYLLAAPDSIEDAERVTDITIGVVLDLIRQLFDFVLIDTGRHVNENAVAAWERSEEVLYVLDQSLVAAHIALRFIDLFGRLGLRCEEPRFILNRYDSTNPVTEDAIVKVLGKPIFARIPRDDRTIEKVHLRSHDLWQSAPNSSLARSVETLARRLNARREATPEVVPGLFARLFGALGARA